MGYYVNTSGTIKIKQGADINKVIDIISDLDIFESVEEYAGGIDVYGYIKYYPEDYVVMYEDIAPYVTSGNIEFTGDDGERWMHQYENGKWVEYDGQIQWVNPHPV